MSNTKNPYGLTPSSAQIGWVEICPPSPSRWNGECPVDCHSPWKSAAIFCIFHCGTWTGAGKCHALGLGAGIMKTDDRQVTTVFTVQPSFRHRHSTNPVLWSVTIVGERRGEVWLHVHRRWQRFMKLGLSSADGGMTVVLWKLSSLGGRRPPWNRPQVLVHDILSSMVFWYRKTVSVLRQRDTRAVCRDWNTHAVHWASCSLSSAGPCSDLWLPGSSLFTGNSLRLYVRARSSGELG